MQHLYRATLLIALAVFACAVSASAAPVASILTPVTAPEYLPQSDPPAIAADRAGRIMIVYVGRGPDDVWRIFSLLQTAGGWQQAVLPAPSVGSSLSTFVPRQLVAREPAKGYHFVGTHSGKVFYWHWQNGQWSPPELVTDDGSAGTGLALDAAGEPLIARSETRFRFYRKVGGAWEETRLSTVLWQRSHPSIVTGARGVPHLLGQYRRVPIVATLPLGRNPTVEANWIISPTGDRESWTSGIPDTENYAKLTLDWPHQLVYAAWSESKSTPRVRRIQLRWAPVGATSAGQWQSATLELPIQCSITEESCRLVSDGYGHVALIYRYWLEGDPSLHFRWLTAAGPGPDVELVRPGTQTEACAFTGISDGTANVCFDHGGTAHLIVRAIKRGEIPANKNRLFYATITGGGNSTDDEPEVTGGGTTGTEGPKPDFIATFTTPKPGTTVRLPYDSLHPVVEVTNQGAQYYGDLTLEANLDGAVVRVTLPDSSGHRLPLFERGQKRAFYLPYLLFKRTPDPNYPPAPVSYQYPVTTKRVESASGLGRKLLSLTVDPDNQIDEADETNNGAQVDYIVYDGSNTADREKGPDGKTINGLNDLALACTPELKSNTPLWRAGYMQRPTSLPVVLSNPRRANFFLNIPVAVYLDGQEIGRQTLASLNADLNLWSGSLNQTLVYGGAPPKPDLAGWAFNFPVDLTGLAEGNHTLKVVVDPDDKFADRKRENNTAEITFKVRGPGGTLRVRAVDLDDGTTPIDRAFISLRGLWAQLTDATGTLEIPDVPPGAYDQKALSGDRTGADPRYYPSFAPPFTVTANQITTVTLPLEKAVVLVGDIYDAATDALLTDETVSVALEDTDFYHPTYVTGAHYQILDVPPGPQTVRAGAYSYLNTEVTADVHRGPQGRHQIDLRLQPGPRAVVEGTVVDEANNRPLANASVWLNGAPRFTMTDAQGHFRLERVAANADYQVLVTRQDYTLESTVTGLLTEGQVKQLPPIKLAKITSRLTSLDFHAITWADFEETSTGKGSFKVRVKYGQFDASLAMLYRTVAGRPTVTVDQLIVGATPGPWCESRVSTYAAPSIICVALVEAKAGVADLYNGNLLGVGQRIKHVYDYATGNFDPAQLGAGGTVVGSYTSQSENPYTPEVSIFGLPVSEGLWGFTATDGATVVRIDRVEVTDGVKTKTVNRQWYSPSMGVYQIGESFNPDNLEVRICLKVMNQNLSVGPLYASSENVITWKPLLNKWARMDPRPY